MTARDEVLVAILKHKRDLAFVREEHWYRIPVIRAPRRLRRRWPPAWLAFYQPGVFKKEAFAIRYYARVLDTQKSYRWELFPDEPHSERSEQLYHQMFIGPLYQLDPPILNPRHKPIIFIQTIWQKFIQAREINDLYDESPLEDLLWTQLQRLGIPAERQEWVEAEGRRYCLDFVVHCAAGRLNIETDGRRWHWHPDRRAYDIRRNTDLETSGWTPLRFDGQQINEQMEDYCLPRILEKIGKLGGVAQDGG